MKAAQISGYSKEIRLEWNDIPIPEVYDNDVLVKVKAAGVNPLDMLILRGTVKLIVDYQFPQTMGNELSGVAEAVGKSATKIKVGDSVYTRLHACYGNQLEEITKFVEAKNIKPSIDSIFAFKDAKAALEKVATGHSKGKVIIPFNRRIGVE